MSTFHERLNKLKDNCGETQAKIASDLEITPQAFSYYLKGREPNYDLLIRLAKYFNCTTDYLLGLSNVKNEQEGKELDEFINIIKEAVNSLDKFNLGAFKRFIRNVVKIKDWKHIPNRAGLIIVSSLDSMTHYIIDIMESMYVARDISRRGSFDQNDCYSIMLGIKNAYKMELRTQRVLFDLFDMLIVCPATKIKRKLEKEGYDADFILEYADEKTLEINDFFDYVESDVHDAQE